MDVSTDVADLFHAVYPRLVVALYATCGHQADAEDAAQEAFTRALGKLRRFVGLDRSAARAPRRCQGSRRDEQPVRAIADPRLRP